MNIPVPAVALGRPPWLQDARWDLTWVVGSVLVVPLSLLLVWGGVSSDLMNLGVTLLAGGPHVFSTFLVTYLDPEYRRRHGRALLLLAVLVPSVVLYMCVAHFQVLMSGFIFAASFHVLQQNAFLADLYRARAGRPEPRISRLVDYAFLFLSFYPIASYKLVHDEFLLGEIAILIPPFVKSDLTWRVLAGLFAAASAVWIGKTWIEWRRGVLNAPKTLLVGVAAGVAFLVPAAASGSRLELAFQTVNVWHSVQYLGLVWLALAARARRPGARGDALARLGGSGRPTLLFYGLCLFFTSLLLAVVVLLCRTDPLGLSVPQYYYLAIFSVLFIHYALDGTFFLASTRGAATPLTAAPGRP